MSNMFEGTLHYKYYSEKKNQQTHIKNETMGESTGGLISILNFFQGLATKFDKFIKTDPLGGKVGIVINLKGNITHRGSKASFECIFTDIETCKQWLKTLAEALNKDEPFPWKQLRIQPRIQIEEEKEGETLPEDLTENISSTSKPTLFLTDPEELFQAIDNLRNAGKRLDSLSQKALEEVCASASALEPALKDIKDIKFITGVVNNLTAAINKDKPGVKNQLIEDLKTLKNLPYSGKTGVNYLWLAFRRSVEQLVGVILMGVSYLAPFAKNSIFQQGRTLYKPKIEEKSSELHAATTALLPLIP